MHLPWREVTPGAGPSILTSITLRETRVLSDLADGTSVLEVGAAYGYSAVAMALAGAASVVSVDPHRWMSTYEPMRANLIAYDVADRVEVRQELSQDALPALSLAGQSFGLIFIDGDHVAAAVEHDLSWAEELLQPQGTIAVHDYAEDCCCPDVRVTCDQRYGPARSGDLVDTLRLVQL